MKAHPKFAFRKNARRLRDKIRKNHLHRLQRNHEIEDVSRAEAKSWETEWRNGCHG